MDQIRNQRF
uniref:Uncharacterized protein n=1 Tax=Romanomermis culicivorax TaxID=13658 RepID=A0A915I313_ROMCU